MDIKRAKSTKPNEDNLSEDDNENIGSSEYFEDLAVPKEKLEQIQEEKKEKITVEKVSKDEIYRNRFEKEQAFIEKFKKNEEIINVLRAPDISNQEEKNVPRKNATFIIIGAFFVAGMLTAAYFYFLRNPETQKAEEIAIGTESPVESSDQAANPEPTQAENKENNPVIEEKEIMPAGISVKVLNEGAIAGSAAKIKGILAGKGYTKTEAGNGEKENIVGTFIYYKEEKFKKLAEAINAILSANKIKAEIMLALTTEQKSGDIVVTIGK